MNKQILHKIAAVSMAIMVLVGSIGLTFTTHYCRTNDSMEQSFLPFPISCDHGEMQACETPTTTTAHQGDSCCAQKQTPKSKSADCCKDETKYAKSHTASDVPQFQIKVVFNQFLAIVMQVLDLFSINKTSKPISAVSKFEQPPPLSGKAIAISNHQLKVDPILL